MTDLSSIQHNTDFTYLHNQSYNEYFIENRKIYRCSIPLCGKAFKFKSEMTRHLASHSSLRPFPCLYPDCGKTFKRQDALNNHIRLHEQATPYICPEKDCGCEFVTKSALRYHILKHSGERIFQCEYPGCDRAFMTLAQLKQHMKASTYHSKLKNFSTTSEETLSYYSPESLEGGTAVELPVIKYDFSGELEKIEKKLRGGSDEEINIKPNEIENGKYDGFDYLKNIYGKTSNEFSEVNSYGVYVKKIPEFDIEENQGNVEGSTKLYNTMKSIIDDSDSANTEFPMESKVMDPIQNPFSTVNTVDNSMCINNTNNTVEQLEAKKESFIDFESWLQTEGLHNLYT